MSKTNISIQGSRFYVNGRVTNEGKTWEGHSMEGLLMNARMVQGIFDDLNPVTVSLFKYPDTGIWDPDRNTDEFVAAMPKWREMGLQAFSINMQGGQPGAFDNWYQMQVNRGFREDGSLDQRYMARLQKVLDKADELGMAVFLGYFYWGQDQTLKSREAVYRAAKELTHWLVDREYGNVLVEVVNESHAPMMTHDVLYHDSVHKMIRFIQQECGGKLPVSVSTVLHEGDADAVLDACDYVLFHGNDTASPLEIGKIAKAIRENPHYKGSPIVVNEDDHYDFEADVNNMKECVRYGISWGFFDFPGYQKVPGSWEIDTPRKKAFFHLLKQMVK